MNKLGQTKRFKEVKKIVDNREVCPDCGSNKLTIDNTARFPGDYNEVIVCQNCGATST